jgi:hypothetical protein
LENLQKNLKFVHNDLKIDNIFYKFIDFNKSDKYTCDNINFYIGDFDGARFEINNIIIYGNT